MEKIQLSYLLIALLGMFIHTAFKVLRNKKKNTGFDFKKFFTDPMNYWRIALTAASVIALMMFTDEEHRLFGFNIEGVTPEFNYFVIGYMNHSLIRNLMKLLKGKIADVGA